MNYQFVIAWKIFLVITVGMIWGTLKITKKIIEIYYYPISNISVTGNNNFTTNYDIYQLMKEKNLLQTFTIKNINNIQQEIMKFPWIQQISIRKKCSNILNVHVIEHIPVAYWNNVQMISVTGKIFNIPKRCKNIHFFPMLYGPKGNEMYVLSNYRIFCKILKSNKFFIKSIDMTTCFSWKIILTNNICLKLGKKNTIERLFRFIRFYPLFLNQIYKNGNCEKNIQYIDLRYDIGFAVGWTSDAELEKN